MINLWLLDTNFSKNNATNSNIQVVSSDSNNESTRNRLVRFISPRDIHKIVDIDHQKLVSGNTSTSHNARENSPAPQISGMVIQNDLTESNIIQSFDQRIQKSITKSRNKIQDSNQKDQSSPILMPATQKKKSISNLLKNLQSSQREIKIMQHKLDDNNNNNSSEIEKKPSSNTFRRAQTVRFLTKSKEGSQMSSQQSKQQNSQQPNSSLSIEKEYDLNSHNQSLLEKKSSSLLQQSYFPSQRSLIVRTKKPLESENGISPIRPSLKKPNSPVLKSESMVVSAEKKKSLFHIKKDIEKLGSSSSSFEGSEKNSFIIQSFPENDMSENEDENTQSDKPLKQIGSSSSSSNNSIKQQSKKLLFDLEDDQKSGNHCRVNVSNFMDDNGQLESPLTPMKPNIKKRILRSTTFNSLESTKDRSHDEMKEMFKLKISGIYKNAEEVSRELIDDLNVYSEALDLTMQFDSCKRNIAKDSSALWTEDPNFIKTKKMLKRRVEERDQTEGSMHPYFQFLGYKAASQVPRDRSRQEIIEQRYAYFLSKDQPQEQQSCITTETNINSKSKITKNLSKSFNNYHSLNSASLDSSFDEKVPSSSRSFKIHSMKSINNPDQFDKSNPIREQGSRLLSRSGIKSRSDEESSGLLDSSKRGSKSPQTVPIVQQILTRYGRNNYDEGNAIRSTLKKIKEGSKQKMNAQYFIDEVNEKKGRLAAKFAKIFSNPEQLKKFFALDNIFKKFSSKQKLDLQKLYRSEKEWDYLMKHVEESQLFLEEQTDEAKKGLKKIKSLSQHSPNHIETLYKKATRLTGLTFFDQEGNPLRQS